MNFSIPQLARAPLAVLLVFATLTPRAGAEPARELVVSFAPSPPGAALESSVRLAPRLAALGLRPRTNLAGLVQAALASAQAAGSARLAPLAPGALAPGGPLAFDPARVWLVEAPDSATAAAALDSLAGDPGIEWAEPNRERAIAALSLEGPFPGDPLFRDGRQWGLRNLGPAAPYGGLAGADIHALEAWQRSVGSNDVLLGVADTGIDPSHPDLAATLPNGEPRIAWPTNVTGLEPATAVYDSFAHGTMVTGVMAARTNNGVQFDSLGMAGVCGGDGAGNFGCRIVPIKIAPFHSGSATSFAIASAALYAASVGARAMNISFAGPGTSRVERLAIASALTHGCVVVAAAGNHGDALPMSPAVYAADGLCIQVGATNESDARTPWSSYGPGLDLVAPGQDIWTTYMTYPSAAGVGYPGYARSGGTSFATPFVTGTVGLLAAARPELIDTDFQHVLRESADDVGAPGVDSLTGWGRLDAAAALAAVGPGIGVWHDEVAGQSFRSLGADSLVVTEKDFGTLGQWRGRNLAELIEVTAIVAVPDSVLGPVRVWPRVGGTTTVRGGYRLPWFVPWAEVEEWNRPGTTLAGGARSFTLRGYLYRVLGQTPREGPENAYVPLPPDQARFGFTVLGPVDQPPSLHVLSPAAGDTLARGASVTVRWQAPDPDRVTAVQVELVQLERATRLLARVPGGAGAAVVTIPCAARPGSAWLRVTALDEHGTASERTTLDLPVRIRDGGCNERAHSPFTVTPNPSRGPALIAGPPRARVTIFDLAGRRLRESVLDDRGGYLWDGRDDAGRPVAPGIYLVRGAGLAGERKLVRIE